MITKLASAIYPIGLAIDATNVYWADESGGTVSKAPIALGATTVLATGIRPFVDAVDAVNVYWTDIGAGTVNQTPIAGGATVVLASGQQSPAGVAVDATSVYWTEVNTGLIHKTPIGGGAIAVLAKGNQPYGVAVDATNVYWANLTGAPNISGFGTPPASGIYGVGSVAKFTPPPTNPSYQIAPNGARFIAVDATNVYWTGGDGSIYKTLKAGGGPVVQLASGQTNPFGIAVDATNVYWCNNADLFGGSVCRTPIAGGGAVTVVVPNLNNPAGVAVDATHVYYTLGQPTQNPSQVGGSSPSALVGGVYSLTPIP